MTIPQDIIFTAILVLCFIFLIVPSTPDSKKWLDELQKKPKQDLDKWKKRQHVINAQLRHERLQH